jgi:hypothetical protein
MTLKCDAHVCKVSTNTTINQYDDCSVLGYGCSIYCEVKHVFTNQRNTKGGTGMHKYIVLAAYGFVHGKVAKPNLTVFLSSCQFQFSTCGRRDFGPYTAASPTYTWAFWVQFHGATIREGIN